MAKLTKLKRSPDPFLPGRTRFPSDLPKPIKTMPKSELAAKKGNRLVKQVKNK